MSEKGSGSAPLDAGGLDLLRTTLESLRKEASQHGQSRLAALLWFAEQEALRTSEKVRGDNIDDPHP